MPSHCKDIRPESGKVTAHDSLSPACQLVPSFVERKTPSLVPAKRFVSAVGYRIGAYIEARPTAIDPLTAPACAVVGGKEDAVATSPGKEIRAARRQERKTSVFVSPVSTAVQLVPLLVEREDAAASPRKEIRARESKSKDLGDPRTDRSSRC